MSVGTGVMSNNEEPQGCEPFLTVIKWTKINVVRMSAKDC